MVLDHPNNFGQLTNVLDRSNSFWSGPNHLVQVQNIKISPEKSNLNLTKMIWIRTKQFAPDQNNLYLAQINLNGQKSFWTYSRTRHK